MTLTKTSQVNWQEIGLTVLPGLWLTFQQSVTSGRDYIYISLSITVILAMGYIYISLTKFRELAPWTWLVIGVLYWHIWHVSWMMYRRETILVVNIMSFLISFAVLYWIYKHFKDVMPRSGWWLTRVLIVVTIVSAYWRVAVQGGHPAYFYFQIMTTLLVLLTPIAIGTTLAKKYGSKAYLFVLAFEPVWIGMLYHTRYIIFFELLASGAVHNPRLELAIKILTIIPFLSFFIIIPIGILRSSSSKNTQMWLIIPSLFVLISVSFMDNLAIKKTSLESLNEVWFLHTLITLKLWIPLLITKDMYENH